jgi:hypothetical protein
LNKYDVLVFDVHNLYYRALWKNTDNYTKIEGQTIRIGGIERSLEMIKHRKEKYLKDGGTMYFLFDNPTSRDTVRQLINYEYKSNRKNMPTEFYKGLNYLEAILKKWENNCYVVREYKTEADDFVEPIIKRHKDNSLLLVSTDMDWARGISENHHWLNKRELYTIDTFEQKYDFVPSRSSVCFYKVFFGDKVDNILPILPQLPIAYFKSIYETYDDIYDFIEASDNGEIDYFDEGWVMRVYRDKRKLTMNWKMVDFIGLDEVDLERHSIKCKFQPEKLKILYSTLGFDPSAIDKRIVINIDFNKLILGMSKK